MASKLLAALVNTNVRFNGLGPIGNPTGSNSAPDMLEKVITALLGVITIVAGVWFIVQLMLGAFNWISAGADKSALERAQKRITNAVIGLFLVVFAYGLAAIVGLILGINILGPANFLITFHPY